jgi:putative aldouronate transport system substrate-binding protein
MKKRSIQFLMLLLVLAMFLTACNGGTTTTTATTAGTTTTAATTTAGETTTTKPSIMTPAGTLPIVTEPVTLTIGLVPNPGVTDYVDNDFTKYVKETAGLTIEFMMFPTEESAQKLDLMVTTGEKLPDISLIGLSRTAIAEYGKQGIFIDQTAYFDSLAYFFNITRDKYCTELEKSDLVVYSKSPDGKRYVFPFFADDPANAQFWGMYINTKWLAKLNLQKPTTTEEFYNVLLAFRDGDPNGNGKKDEIPAMGNREFYGDTTKILMNSFIYYSDYMMNVDNGVVSAPFIQDDFKEGVKYCKKLVDEGLISPLTFTQDYAQMRTILEVNTLEEVKVGLFSAHPTVCFGSPDSWARTNYYPIPPVKGPKGLDYVPKTILGRDFIAAITKDCATPEIAFRFFDYLCEEEVSITSRWGKKGVDWLEPTGTEIPTYPECGVKWVTNFNPWTAPNNKIWRTDPMLFMPTKFAGAYAMAVTEDANTNYFYKMVYDGVPMRNGKNPPQLVTIMVYTEEEQEEIGQLWTDLQTYVNESRVAFMTGDMNIDTDWDSYIATCKQMGVDKYTEVVQKVWTRMNS